MNIENEIQSKGLTAPRVTPNDIENSIKHEFYFTAYDGVDGDNSNLDKETLDELTLVTFCVLILNNGFKVVGHSSCVSIENYDQQIGEDIARDNAINEIWPLLGYSLKERIHQDKSYVSRKL